VFQPAVPVAKVLQGIHNSEYVLPAIQREFVWKTEQTRRLFDSLMRGYPIGAFLFWKVEPSQAAQFTFYGFITDYHERHHPFASVKQIPAEVDGLPNLQLLPGLPNIEKQATLPAAWLKGPFFPSDAAREQYVRDADLLELPEGLDGFLDFYEARRKRLETRLKLALGVG